jgi:hypothetical protein
VSGDRNAQMDVYEWEREGAGACAVGGGDAGGGCLFLISTGQSATESYFGDASVDGGDVFFFTRQSLASQDRDSNADLYDARIDGGIAAQNPEPVPACEGEVCREATAPAPTFAALSSTSLSGAGNVEPAPVSGSSPKVKPKQRPTGGQRLAKALRSCQRKPRRQRAHCRSRVHAIYGREFRHDTSRRHG